MKLKKPVRLNPVRLNPKAVKAMDSELSKALDTLSKVPVKSHRKELPHVEDVCSVFQRYSYVVASIKQKSLREPKAWQEQMDIAQEQFRKEMEALGIYLDYTKR